MASEIEVKPRRRITAHETAVRLFDSALQAVASCKHVYEWGMNVQHGSDNANMPDVACVRKRARNRAC